MKTRVDTFEASEKKREGNQKKLQNSFLHPHYEKMETSSRNIVTKRNGRTEAFDEGKFKAVLNKFAGGLDHVDTGELCAKTVQSMPDQIDTDEILRHLAATAASYAVDHPDYDRLAARAFAAHLHKRTPATFSDAVAKAYAHTYEGNPCPLVSSTLYKAVMGNAEVLDQMVVPSRDESLTYFGQRTLLRAYLLQSNDKASLFETPQYMFLRLAVFLHTGDDDTPGPERLEGVRKTYEAMSTLKYTHATPTLFNAGTPRPQLSSCFLLAMKDDSIEGIFDTIHQCAKISKLAGGIGISTSNIRASGSYIRGTNGHSNGLTPMLRVLNNVSRYIDQCLLPETLVHTTSGPRPIESLVNGDKIVCGEHAEAIENVLEHSYEGSMLRYKTLHSIRPVTITPEHPVSVLRNFGKVGQAVEWVEATDLRPGDRVGVPVPTYVVDHDDLTMEDCFIYGILLACGEGTSANFPDTMAMTHRMHMLEAYFHDRFVETSREGTVLRWKAAVHLPFKHGDFYDVYGNKRIGEKWLHLPVAKTERILLGLMTNGTWKEDCLEVSYDGPLAETVRYLLLRCRVLAKGKMEKGGKCTLRIPPTKAFYGIQGRFHKGPIEDAEAGYDVVDNVLYTRVQTIEPVDYKGVVYDLQMPKHHRYVTVEGGMVHNGGGKRKGSIAVYLEPWHADIEEFLELRLVTGKEEARARDLFYALWISDLFMDRVRNNEKWSLFCPDKAPGLNEVYGKAFVDLYTRYEKEKRYVRRVNAQDLWLKLLVSQVETGVPYMLYKDACNEKSNQKNLGTIKSSNLCTEVVEYSSKDEVAVCNLASLSLPAFVGEDRCFDYADFHATVKLATKNLNRVIDRNMYPVEEAQRSNERHRPIGLGVQGLADCLIKMHVSYDSAEGIAVDRKIFEVMYHAAMEASWELAVVKGAYETFPGSPTSKGTFQFDLWGETEKVYAEGFYGKDEWEQLKAKVVKDGIRNSLLVAPMPTATTSQIMGNFTESFSPLPSVLYQRRTLSGDFVLSHPQFIREMVEAGLWNKTMQAVVQKARGCVEHIPKIPETIRRRYRSCWGMSQKWVIDHAAARGPFICQSQSMNVFMEEPTTGKLTSLHFYAHKKGLKTGMYYLRSQAKAKTIQFGVEEECESCGS